MSRVQIGIAKDLALELDEIGFAVKVKTRPSIIAFLIANYKEQRK